MNHEARMVRGEIPRRVQQSGVTGKLVSSLKQSAILLVAGIGMTAAAAVVNFAWDYDLTVTNVGSFNLKRATNVAGPYVTVTNVAYPSLWASDEVTPGIYFWYVTAVDSFWGVESDPSNVISSPAPAPLVKKLTISKGP